MAFCDASIFQWQSQAQLMPVWEEYPPPFSNDVVFFDETEQTDNYRALLESEYLRYRPLYSAEEEEKAFPHLMPFFEVASPSEHNGVNGSVIARTRMGQKTEPVDKPRAAVPANVKSELRWQNSAWSRAEASEIVTESPPPVPRKSYACHQNSSAQKSSKIIYSTELENSGPTKTESTQEFYLEDSISQEESPEDESEGVEVSEEEAEVPAGRKRKSSSQDEEERDEKEKTPQPKKRQRTSPEQLEILERVYEQERLPGLDLRKELAQKLKMTPRRVQVWFQNKRAKEKRMVAAHSEFSDFGRSMKNA